MIDDYDKISRNGVHNRVAEILKQLSDEHCRTKMLIVGVSDSLDSLFRGEPSLPRGLATVHLKRFSNDELAKIILKGEESLGVVFEKDAFEMIVSLSDGFASHLHSLCLYATHEMAYRLFDRDRTVSSSKRRVTKDDVYSGIDAAIENSEPRLRKPYEQATVTTWRKTQLFQFLIWAIAMSSDTEVHVSEIVENMNTLTDGNITQAKISYHLGKLQKDEKGQVIKKIRSGVYRFCDPLMRGYVRIQLEKYNVNDRDGQLQFSFMEEYRSRPKMAWAPTVRRYPL